MKKILKLEADISANADNTKRSNEVIETETKRITGLVEFIGGEK